MKCDAESRILNLKATNKFASLRGTASHVAPASVPPCLRGDSSLGRHRAFSLVELMVVLAILIILASIFIPYMAKLRESDNRVR